METEVIITTLIVLAASGCIGVFAVLAGFVIGFVTIYINTPEYEEAKYARRRNRL